jgi:HAD superfamily hydrolase (TIGR01484 family)
MANRKPAPIEKIDSKRLANLSAIFFDIDDTFSGGAGQHRILGEAYQSLWDLKRAGLLLVPVTGRPAGWCDLITRMWPVSAVVGENGAFYSYLDSSKHPEKLVKKYLESPKIRAENALKLKRLRAAVLKKFSGAKCASDQAYREFDLAIDYCEDVARWPDARVQKLIEFCQRRGAIAKLSSIHVNTWFGKYDKWSCVQRVLKDRCEKIQNVVYIGDSPNDEPFFEKLEFTVGVANVCRFLDRMQFSPAYVTRQEGGLGFNEFAQMVLSAKPRSRSDKQGPSNQGKVKVHDEPGIRQLEER